MHCKNIRIGNIKWNSLISRAQSNIIRKNITDEKRPAVILCENHTSSTIKLLNTSFRIKKTVNNKINIVDSTNGSQHKELSTL